MNKDQWIKLTAEIIAFYRNLKVIYEAYSQFPALIEKEHKLVLSKDLEELEGVIRVKEELTNKIHESVLDNKKICAVVESWFEGVSFTSVSDLINYLSSLDCETGVQFEQALVKLKDIHTKLQKLIEDITPQIEQNRYLLTKLMEEKRNNFLFWQEVISDTLASYNRQGIQKGSGASSIFKISA